jgi:hypothetical protein
MARELPYDFDLHYDVKTMEQVERIAKGEADCSDATPEDLIALFLLHDLPVPACLDDRFDIKDTCHRMETYAMDIGSDRKYYTLLMAIHIIKTYSLALETCDRAVKFYARVEESSKEERLAVGTDHHTMVHDACKEAAELFNRRK